MLSSSTLRTWLLRLFGASIGKSVVIRHRVTVKFPWLLSIGDHSWIGEGSWLDNLAPIRIGANVCISQDAYLCTGNHDWSRATFDLIYRSIVVEDQAWLGARVSVGPGVTIGSGAIISLGSVVTHDVAAGTIVAPASLTVRSRRQRCEEQADGAAS